MPEISPAKIVFSFFPVFGDSDISVITGSDIVGIVLAFAVAKAILFDCIELVCNKFVNSPLDTEVVSLFDVRANQASPALASATS